MTCRMRSENGQACNQDWCWICGRKISGGGHPTHYAWWNILGCPGTQMNESFQSYSSGRRACYQGGLCAYRLLAIPALVVAAGLALAALAIAIALGLLVLAVTIPGLLSASPFLLVIELSGCLEDTLWDAEKLFVCAIWPLYLLCVGVALALAVAAIVLALPGGAIGLPLACCGLKLGCFSDNTWGGIERDEKQWFMAAAFLWPVMIPVAVLCGPLVCCAMLTGGWED